METSFETYLRGELKTYSARTITLLHELTLRQQQDGVNGAALNLLNQVQQYGYATLEQAGRPSRGSLTAFPASLRARLYLSLALSGMACLQKSKPLVKRTAEIPRLLAVGDAAALAVMAAFNFSGVTGSVATRTPTASAMAFRMDT